MQTILSPDDLIARINNPDDSIRGPAWQGAAKYGAAAVKPLAGLMTAGELESARAARRALWLIVRHAARPGAAKEASAVTKELLPLLQNQPAAVQREVVWMLSEISGDDATAPLAALLSDPELREDARCALMRLPGRKVTAAMKSAFAAAPEEFKFALAESLRKRGETVRGYPTQKRVPSRPTNVVAQGTG